MMIVENQEELQTLITRAHVNYQKSLRAWAFYKLHNRETSDDLVQDTFIKTWLYLVRGGKIELMRSFLYRILNNLIIDEYRKRKTISLDSLLEKGFDPSLDEPRHVSSTLDASAAALLIPLLSTKYKKIMTMRYMQGLTLKEMALITNQTRNAVAVQAHRGLAKLRRLYVC